MDNDALLALSADVSALLDRPLPRGALGTAGLLGAISAVSDLRAWPGTGWMPAGGGHDREPVRAT